MTKVVFISFFVALTLNAFTQFSVDFSNAPVSTATNNIEGFEVSVSYSSPTLSGEIDIWNKIAPGGIEWPEEKHAPIVTINRDVQIGFNKQDQLKAGTYQMQLIPENEQWQVVFKKTDSEQVVVQTTIDAWDRKEWKSRLLYYVTEPDPANGMAILRMEWGFKSAFIYFYPPGIILE